ncbi:MAG TPA: hypothetical protein VHU22_24980 [Xanthobacteraceae bacterium]|jgi:hypothetical protein|nr:hypothetical protein [Xanthobacteraceae bacterium]
MSDGWIAEQLKPLSMFELAKWWADGLKIAGAGNGAGVLACIVGLQSYHGILLKVSGVSFSIGIFAFVLAFAMIHKAVFAQDEVAHAARRKDVAAIEANSALSGSSMMIANYCAIISVVAFLVGCFVGLVGVLGSDTRIQPSQSVPAQAPVQTALREIPMQENAWQFGSTQLLTVIGFVITIGIAIGGFRTFGRWKREKIEERRIEIAFEALSIAQESKLVFGRIRNPAGYEAEWKAMPVKEGETESDRSMRGGSYAILARLSAHADYFDRVSRLQPKAVAVFGDKAERAFHHLNAAQDLVREAAMQLTWFLPVHPEKPTKEDFDMRMKLRGDLWAGFQKPDRVENAVIAFRSEAEAAFKPVIQRRFQSSG